MLCHLLHCLPSLKERGGVGPMLYIKHRLCCNVRAVLKLRTLSFGGMRKVGSVHIKGVSGVFREHLLSTFLAFAQNKWPKTDSCLCIAEVTKLASYPSYAKNITQKTIYKNVSRQVRGNIIDFYTFVDLLRFCASLLGRYNGWQNLRSSLITTGFWILTKCYQHRLSNN